MSTTHYIQTVLEILLFAVVIVCLIYEPAIAKWEQRQAWKMFKALKQKKVLRK